MEPTGDVITWGDGSHGQLGCKDFQNKPVSSSGVPTKLSALLEEGVSTVECGNAHMAAVNANGMVLTWGRGVEGQLGHAFTPDSQHPEQPDVPVPRLVKGLENVISVACGKSHTIALTKDGVLYGWGATVAGQAGIENDGYILPTPRRIQGLRSKMVSVAAGELHSVAVAENGMVYTWGWGENGRLGHGSERTLYEPTLLPLHDEVVVAAACGAGHTMICTRDGTVLSWGLGTNGQLGHGRWRNRFSPSRLKFLSGISVSVIACGSWHSAAVTTTGQLYCWGCGEAGQLGNGKDSLPDEVSQCLPRLVRHLLGKECQFVACGIQHTMAIIKAKRSSKIASKKAVEEANLERQFQREEDRRTAFLKTSREEQVARRKQAAALDLEFIQSRISRSAGEYVTKSIVEKKARDEGKAEHERELERRTSPTRFRGTSAAAARGGSEPEGSSPRRRMRPSSRPSSAGTAGGGASSIVTQLTGVPLGYRTHTYRSGLRSYLSDLELHRTNRAGTSGGDWGRPAHFMPVGAKSTPHPPRPPRSGGTTAGNEGRPQTARAARGQGGGGRPSTAQTARPATARDASGRREAAAVSIPGRGGKRGGGQGVRPQTAREAAGRGDEEQAPTVGFQPVPPSVPPSDAPLARGGVQAGTSGFRPPSSWDMYWKEAR